MDIPLVDLNIDNPPIDEKPDISEVVFDSLDFTTNFII